MAKKISGKEYEDWSKEELVKEIVKIKSTTYGLVWHRDLPEEKIDILINPDARTPNEMFPNEMAGKPFPVLKEVKGKAIESDKSKLVNLLIEGDNYHSLAVLNFTHREAVDLIYIDPPYNTGHKDFIYNDKFVDEEDSFRHSKWLSFMEKRLKLAKNLLKSTGVIFISIDDNEQAPLKLLCDEVFGVENFVTTIHVQMSTVQGQKVKSAKSGNIVKNAEYILVYSKNGRKDIGKNVLYDPIEYDNHYSLYLTPIKEGTYKEHSLTEKLCSIDELFRELKLLSLASEKNDKRTMSNSKISEAYLKLDKVRDFINKNSQFIVRVHDTVDIKDADIIKRIKPGLIIEYGTKERSYLVGYNGKKEYKQRIRLSEKIKTADDYYKTYGVTTIRGDWWPGFYLDMGNVAKEGGVEFKNGKKPVRLIKQLINFALDKNGTILDFFAGSGTTGQAVLELNKEKHLSHRFVLCTNNEENISTERTHPRLVNVIKGIDKKDGLGGNLKYYTTDFVEAEPTDKNKRKLVKESTDMLCILENAFELIQETPEFKIFKNTDKYVGVIFYEEAIEDYKKAIKKIEGRFNTYVFSMNDDPHVNKFADVKNKVKLCAIPEVILKVYREIFK